MRLFADVLTDEIDELIDNRVRLRFIGDIQDMPERVRSKMQESMRKTEGNSGLNLQVAINYGSRKEMTEAARRLAIDVRDGKIRPEDIDEPLMATYLYTRDIPDPELLIRTGGEMRLSNYLLWQSAYTEFYVTPVLWPDFGADDFDQAIVEFSRRERRWGGD
jgi:undecaprenyl diphosphate synthase